MAKKLPRFDDGGDVNLDPIDTSWVNQYYVPDNSGAPSASDIAALTSGSTSGANSIQSQVGSNPAAAMENPAGSNTGAVGGALSKALSSLGLGGGNTSNTAALNAAVGLLSAYGKYKSNSAGTKLPNMPALGALPTLPGSNTAGYGPAGGYGYQNYAGAKTGLGYAPKTQSSSPSIPSYFTYGSGPEHQFFQQVTGKGSPIVPVTMAKGGAVPCFDMGGMVPNMGATPMGPPGGAPAPMMGPQPGSAPQAPRPQGPPPAPMGAPPGTPPSTMMQRMQAAKSQRPFATGGSVPHFDAGGLMLNTVYPGLANQSGDESDAERTARHQRMTNSLHDWRQLFEEKPETDARHFREAASAAQSTGYADGGAPHGALSAAMNPGVSRHVTGPGDGTSDSIPARLANGEYVMDAQLVSMLGNGDNSAGAKRLDEFRKNVRAHKGAALAKGKMAPDAKALHKYMGGQ